MPSLWGEEWYPATDEETTFLTDDEIAFVADNYNNGFPSTIFAEYVGGQRYINYAAYDYAAVLIARDVQQSTLTRQPITRYLIVNNMFAHQSGSHWISIVYTITPREILGRNLYATVLSLMTPAQSQATQVNSLHLQDTSNLSLSSSSASSLSDFAVSHLLNDFVNHVYLTQVALSIIFFVNYISSFVFAVCLTVLIHVLVYIINHLPDYTNLRSRICHHRVC